MIEKTQNWSQITDTMLENKKTIITDGQDLAERAEQLKAEGITDVVITINTLNYTKYKESNNGKELGPVIEGINKAVGQQLHITLQVSLKEGYNEAETLDLLQLTFQHKYDIVFMPTISYEFLKSKMPALRPIDGDFEDVEMFKYPGALGRIGFLKESKSN